MRGPWSPGLHGYGPQPRTMPRISARAARSAHGARAEWRAAPREGVSTSRPRHRRRNSQAACGGLPPRRAANMSAAAPEEVAGDELGGIGMPMRKLVRSDRCRDRFAIDQHSVAIEDDHEPPAPARPPALHWIALSNHRAIGIVRRWQKSGTAPSVPFLHRLLSAAGKIGSLPVGERAQKKAGAKWPS